METDVEVAVLKEKIINVERLFDRIDDAIGKIAEVNNNVSKMLAVHEERLGMHEKADEILSNKIDRLREQMVTDHDSVLQRLSNLEKKVWAGFGAIGVITLFIQLVGPEIVTRMMPSVKVSDTIVEVSPNPLELYRQQIHKPNIGSTK